MQSIEGTLRGPDLARRIAVRDFLNKAIPGRGMCAYDSAVIAGNGIGALAFAGWLAQSPLFEGKVTVVAPPVVESRRLINGVSLRGRGIDFMSAALDIHRRLLEGMSGSADACQWPTARQPPWPSSKGSRGDSPNGGIGRMHWPPSGRSPMVCETAGSLPVCVSRLPSCPSSSSTSRIRVTPAQLQRGTASTARQRHHRQYHDRREAEPPNGWRWGCRPRSSRPKAA